jgi:hypothetical protein
LIIVLSLGMAVGRFRCASSAARAGTTVFEGDRNQDVTVESLRKKGSSLLISQLTIPFEN